MPKTSLTDAMVAARRAELLAKGYRAGIVEIAIEWAVNSASGMEDYHSPDGDAPVNLFEQFLGTYLRDTERYIKAFSG